MDKNKYGSELRVGKPDAIDVLPGQVTWMIYGNKEGLNVSRLFEGKEQLPSPYDSVGFFYWTSKEAEHNFTGDDELWLEIGEPSSENFLFIGNMDFDSAVEWIIDRTGYLKL